MVRVQCTKCKRYDTPSRHPRSAKILLLDIETLYMEVKGVWDLRTEYIRPEKIVKDWSILCYAAKWLFEPEIQGAVVTPKEAVNREEGSILGGIWKLMNEADIIVTQNGINFDIKRLNTKFLKYGYSPPSPYLNVDTLRVAKDKFAFPSNKLDHLGKTVLGLDGKIKMEEQDWDDCAEGKKDALDKMLVYCKKDVAPLLEDLYLKFLPWISSHPNLNVYTDHDKEVCPKCESSEIKWTGVYPTPMGLWSGFRCGVCGATGRGTKKEHKIKAVSVR